VEPDVDVDVDPRPVIRALTEAEIERLRAHGVEREAAAGDIVFRPGDIAQDLVVILSGVVEGRTTASGIRR
jgi:CRP-like cAMP-binding protein